MSLWDWTLKVYEKPGVPEACLRLQDHHGQNTSFLLWAVWAGGVDSERLAQGAQIARDWETKVLAPIREVRRLLKASAPHIDDLAREGLRTDVKAAELRAERVLMEALEALAGRNGATSSPTLLLAATKAWGRPVSETALSALAKALA
jgi:uncharacterized protein (TIGR02444 family)